MKNGKASDNNNDCTQVRYLKQWVQQQSKKPNFASPRKKVIERISIDPEYRLITRKYHSNP